MSTQQITTPPARVPSRARKALAATLAGAVLAGGLGTLSLGLAGPAMAAGAKGPEASHDEWAIVENHGVYFNPLENDKLPAGYNTLKIVGLKAGQWGTKTETEWGTFQVANGDQISYLPAKDFSGQVWGQYRVYNAKGDYIEQNFLIVVLPEVDTSTGTMRDDEVTVYGAKPTTINVLDNDTAPKGKEFHSVYIGDLGPVHQRTLTDDKATYTIDGAGKLTVTPKGDPRGTVELKVAAEVRPQDHERWDEATSNYSFITIDFGEEGDFTDNQPGAVYYQPIRWMQDEGLTKGYSDGAFRPSKPISRAEIASFLYRMADVDYSAPEESKFRDVSTTSGHYEAIAWMVENDIVAGYKDGSFKPNKSITRGEMARIIFGVAANGDYKPTAGAGFSDVKAGQNFYKEITWLKDNGIIHGYKDGSYLPSQQITRGEAAVILRNVDPFVEDRF